MNYQDNLECVTSLYVFPISLIFVAIRYLLYIDIKKLQVTYKRLPPPTDTIQTDTTKFTFIIIKYNIIIPSRKVQGIDPC